MTISLQKGTERKVCMGEDISTLAAKDGEKISLAIKERF